MSTRLRWVSGVSARTDGVEGRLHVYWQPRRLEMRTDVPPLGDEYAQEEEK